MVKKKKDNPLAGLTRFNVDPNPETSATLYSKVELLKDIERWHDSDWDSDQKLAKSAAKKLKNLNAGKGSVLDNQQPPYSNTGLNDILEKASVHQRPGGDSPERWLPEHFSMMYRHGDGDYRDEVKKVGKGLSRYDSWDSGTYKKGGKSGKKPQARKDLEAAEPWRETTDNPNDLYISPEYLESVKRKYDETTKGIPSPSVADIFTPGYKPREGFKLSQSVADMGSKDKPKEPYSTAIPHVSQEQMAKEALAYIKQVSPDDTKGIAETEATLSKIQKTGKVEEPALPQASEKPVAKKKKNEPEYIPSKSEKDFAAGRMPGITGTAEEASAALERTRKASTSKVTGKAKVKLQEEIAAHPMYRGTRQLSDEEVAANEAGGSIRASESVAATAKTPKSKGKGKKKDLVPHPDIPGAMTDANAERVSEKPYIDDPAETLAANAKTPKMETVDETAPSAPASTQVPRNDSSGNIVDVSRFAGKPKTKETTPGYDALTPEQKVEYDDLVAQGYREISPRKSEPTDSAEEDSPSTPSSMPAPTAGTGVASPTPTWGAPTGAGVSSPTATPTGPTASPSMPLPLAPLPSSAGSGGPRSTPAPAPKVKGPGLGSRIGGFFGGHGGRGGGKAPAPAAGPSTSTSSANTTNINYGAPTFGDQTNLGRNDFGGGSGGAGGSGSINMSANSNQANQVQGQNVRIGGSYGGTVGGPVVASTSGRATSNNPRATVLSTGGPASQTQGHPRAQNAKRGGRPTTSNQTPTAPKTKNPRQQKP